MNLFRQSYLAKTFSLITGLVFLNMSFFLAEVSMLELGHHPLVENIVKLMTSSGFEEERDGETGNDNAAKEVDLLMNQALLHHHALVVICSKTNGALADHYPHANYSQTFSPPPDPAYLF